MKAVIIGGGVAGLTVGILLHKKKWEVIVNERSQTIVNRGHAFLMSSDGQSILSEFSELAKLELARKKVDLFSLKRPEGEEIIKIKLNGWYCLTRVDLINYLYSALPEGCLKMGREFSHFIYENNKIIAATFKNGEIEYGDIFIGADGSNSKVREEIFGNTNFTPTDVKEIVGIATKKIVNENTNTIFQKIQSNQKGLAFGYIPASDNKVVWFIQFDKNLALNLDEKNTDSIKSFCLNTVGHFSTETKNILEATDFSNAYVWQTRDFDLLPSFHKDNVVLIGDAAHLALPFTSAGTTNAILDAKYLSDYLQQYNNYENAFNDYYKSRSENLKNHVEQGRQLKKVFLNPKEQNERDYLLPLVSDKDDATKENVTKPIKILYFTDPICSSCWIIQPILRKLKLEYDNSIEIFYKMGGLLPSWKNYDKGIIKKPSDAAKHWEEMSSLHNTPLDGDIWLEDPLQSSYPPSIAFKAAQMQNNNKAVLFLRRLKEMLFLEKKNISKWEFVQNAALSCGLDSALLLKNMQYEAKKLFEEDLELSKKLNIRVFPTLIFFDGNLKKHFIEGAQPYEKFEKIIDDLLPSLKKKNSEIKPIDLFSQFNNMTEKEFAFLSNLKIEESNKILLELYKEGKIDKYESKNGTIWISKIPE